jgi:DNA anti-recombination protein RmuC
MPQPNTIAPYFQQLKDSVITSVQQIGSSFKQTATQATDKAVNTVSTSIGQAKESLGHTVQTAEQIQNTTSTAIQTAVTSSINDWLTQHPAIFRFMQIVTWGVNHPIISLVILVFILAITWNLIKAIGTLIESASLSILKIPFQLLKSLFNFILLLSYQLTQSALKKNTDNKTHTSLPTLTTVIQSNYQDKQQRLVEISSRLAAIQKEQNQLLQEAAEIMSSESTSVSHLN